MKTFLILVTTLSMTLPIHDRYISKRLEPPSCDESVIPLTDLSRLIIHGAPQYEPVRIIADIDVRGREGQLVSYVFDDSSLVWTIWVTTKDFTGNESCESNHIGINLGPGIPDPTSPPPGH